MFTGEFIRDVADLEKTLNVCKKLGEAMDLREAAAIVLDTAMEMVDAEAGTFWFLDEDRDLLVPLAARGPRTEMLEGLYLRRGEGIAGRVLETGEPVLVEDVTRDNRWVGSRFDAPAGFLTRSMLVLPLTLGQTVIGSLQLVNKQQAHVFGPQDLHKCRWFLTYVGQAFGFSYRYDALWRFVSGLLRVVSGIVEARDPGGKGHAERVCRYALLLAGALGMKEEEQQMLSFASLLHDIGKIMAEEPARHPSTGAQLFYQLEPKRFVRPIWLGILYHHEKYDGTGYPAGLKGEDIPLNARIIAVADVFDHLTRNREISEIAAALEELLQFGGSHLDPYLVARFIEAMRQEWK